MTSSRQRIWIALGVLLLVVLAVFWWRGRADDEGASRDETASGEPRSRTKRGIGADAGDDDTAAKPRARWQERGASVAGTVREKGGGPLAAAEVCAWLGDTTAPSSMTREPTCTTTGPDGSYRLENLPPMFMTVSASAAEHIPAFYEQVPGQTEFQLQRGEARTGVDIELPTGGVAVRGVVKDIAGGVIEGALVASESWTWRSAGQRGRARTRSDDKGEFTLWVGPGEAWISADAEGYATGSASGATPGFTFEILLTPESVLAGVVVRASDGTPVSGVRVLPGDEWGWDDSGSAYTDDEGRFRIDRLAPGRYKPVAKAQDGYGRAAQSVHLGLGESAEDLRIALHPASSVRARVLVAGDPERPCEQAGATLTDEIAKQSAYAQANADGTIEFVAVLPGTYDVSVWCKGMVPLDRYDPVVVAAEPLPELVWTVNEGLAITGIVVGPGGEPVERARVSVQAKSAAPRGQVASAWGELSGPDGRFRAAGLVPGTYALRVQVEGEDVVAPAEPTDVELTADKPTDVRIEVGMAGSVEGRVLDTQGKPVADASVTLRGDEHGWGGNASSRDDGTFTIKGVRPEAYRATAARGWTNTMRAPGTKDDDVQGERVTVSAGETATVELVVEDQSGTIRGRVIDEAGGPVDDAFVHANRESDSASKSAGSNRQNARWGGWDQKPVLTDQDGSFEITGMAPGKHTVFATRKGGGEGLTEHVEVGTRDVVVRIEPGASISGTVAIAGGGAPKRFQVHAEDRTLGVSQSEEFYETSGAWRLDELPPGNYEVSVDATEGRDTETLKLGEAEQKTGVALVLEPKVDVDGTVVDLETGDPVANVSVSIQARQGGFFFGFGGDGGEKENVSDAQGKFTVRAAPTGKVRVVMMPRAWGDETYGWSFVGATIPSDVTRHTLPSLGIAKSRLQRGKRPGDLGFTLKESPPEIDAEDFPITIAFIRPGGPAASTELAVGDVVTAVDGHDVTGESRHRYGTLTRVPQGTKVGLELASGKSVAIVAGKPP